MSNPKQLQDFVNERGYTAQDWHDVSDNPELSDAELAQMRPFSEVLPDLNTAIRKGRGKQKSPTKQQITLRLDRHIVEAFQARGAGWQNQINEALKFTLKQQN